MGACVARVIVRDYVVVPSYAGALRNANHMCTGPGLIRMLNANPASMEMVTQNPLRLRFKMEAVRPY